MFFSVFEDVVKFVSGDEIELVVFKRKMGEVFNCNLMMVGWFLNVGIG